MLRITPPATSQRSKGSFALLVIGWHLESVGCARQDSLTLTLGLRADAAFFPDAVAPNDVLRDSLGIDTGRLPSGQVLWSPRMGVNYNLKGEGRTFLRGGLGVFSGRPPYQWLGNAYRDNGMQELFLDCRGAGAVPTFDPNTQPANCANGTGAVLRLSFFEPGVRFPQNLKLALGVDHTLPAGVVGTVDVLYTRAVRQLYLTDANLRPPDSVARGEGNRPLYGTISGTATSYSVTPARRVASVGQVVRVANRSGDHALSFTLQLRKRFGDGTTVEQDSVYALLDDLIRAEPCLREQRGRIMDRNSCRNPWFGTLNARLTKAIPTGAGQSLELAADVYNVLNLLNRQWGQSRVTIPDPWVQTLRLVGTMQARPVGSISTSSGVCVRSRTCRRGGRWN